MTLDLNYLILLGGLLQHYLAMVLQLLNSPCGNQACYTVNMALRKLHSTLDLRTDPEGNENLQSYLSLPELWVGKQSYQDNRDNANTATIAEVRKEGCETSSVDTPSTNYHMVRDTTNVHRVHSNSLLKFRKY
jgi:hypothetical protein